MLKEVLSSRAKQRLILAARAMDKSEEKSLALITEEVDAITQPNVPAIEMATGIVSIVGQRMMKKPAAIVAGIEELLRKR
ncbi:MAG: hypothetical protein ACOY3M_02725 [Patescibacteria group bacterium]